MFYVQNVRCHARSHRDVIVHRDSHSFWCIVLSIRFAQGPSCLSQWKLQFMECSGSKSETHPKATHPARIATRSCSLRHVPRREIDYRGDYSRDDYREKKEKKYRDRSREFFVLRPHLAMQAHNSVLT